MKIGWQGNETVNPAETVRLGKDLSNYQLIHQLYL